MDIGAIHKTAQEQGSRRRPRHAARWRVVQIRDAGLDQILVGVVKWQAPDRILDAGCGGGQGGGVIVGVGKEGRDIGANGDTGRPGQRRHRDDEVRVLFASQGQRVGQDKAAFGVGIVNLDRQPLARGQDVLRAESIGGNRVFHRRDQDAQADRHVQRHDHMGKAQDGSRAAHILFHQPHRGAGFDVQAAGVKADTLADKGQAGAGGAPSHVDQTRRRGAGAADGVDQGEVVGQQVVTRGHADFRAVLIGEAAGGGFQVGGTHVVCGGVDKIASQHFTSGDDLQAICIDTIRRDKLGCGRFGAAVAGEVVGFQQPAQRGLGQVAAGQAGRDGIGPSRQFACGRGDGKAGAFAAGGCALPHQRHSNRAIRAGDAQGRARSSLKAAGVSPGARRGGDRVQVIGVNHMQRRGGRASGGKHRKGRVGHSGGPF